ncbi:hypothetical protein VNO77_26927 [Canavalia gladiata]|uniref:Uncharacterized protein n=1 Tax=Canavalia gladiata TaxID=3824 RepID=A0AAN9KWW0_CANGL
MQFPCLGACFGTGARIRYMTLLSPNVHQMQALALLTIASGYSYSNRFLQGKQQRLVQKKAKTERCLILARNTKFLDEDLMIAFISQIMTIGVVRGNHQLPQTPVLCHVQTLFIGLQHLIAESQDQAVVASIASTGRLLLLSLNLIDVINSNHIELGINSRKGIHKAHDSLSPYRILLIIQTEGNESLLLPFQCCWYELCSWLEELLSSSTVMERPEKKRKRDLEEEWL